MDIIKRHILFISMLKGRQNVVGKRSEVVTRMKVVIRKVNKKEGSY
jgi:hypothetical protein